MNVPELYRLMLWIDRDLAKKGVNERYNALVDVLTHNVNNQPKQPIEEARNALDKLLREIDVASLSVEQLKFLERLKIAPFIGEEGAKNVDKILLENQLDIATALSRTAAVRKDVAQGIASAKKIADALNGQVEDAELPKEEALIRVSFQRDASIANVADLKKWANEWLTIGRGIAMLHGKSPQDVRVVGATNGSLIVELAAIYAIAGTISAILLAACAVADKVLDLMKKAEEFKGMRLKNQKLVAEIEKEAEEQKKIGIEEITAKVIADLGRPVDGEKKEALERAVERLLSFVQKGGEIDCVMPEPTAGGGENNETQQAEIARLRDQFKQVRIVETKIRHLEFKMSSDREQ